MEKILLVEDNPAASARIRTFIQKMDPGYEVIVFPMAGGGLFLRLPGDHFPVYFRYTAGRLQGDEPGETASGAGSLPVYPHSV